MVDTHGERATFSSTRSS